MNSRKISKYLDKLGKFPTNPKLTWIEQKQKLKITFKSLTEKDLKFDESERESMFELLQEKLGVPKLLLVNITNSI